MNLYRLTRTDHIGYDETRAVIVAAESKADARAEARYARGDQMQMVWNDATVELLGTADPAITAPDVLLTDNKGG